ncbi:hypothetical protein I7I53_07279 [Histoplasma capsulatum var. duboisii H88]|uniref:Uncharacterized protein n=1 Tax=Ajellomyces capsulatus (strain H88) TaxID=544711 RepID=A0A8A1LHB7_AJEC8|nr:hypothetical protein I7I53_07279 [Histoplasma capsulatum var. duboisii H88]
MVLLTVVAEVEQAAKGGISMNWDEMHMYLHNYSVLLLFLFVLRVAGTLAFWPFMKPLCC